MLLRYFYDDELAQASYLVGCVATGEALVIDPLRDIAPYLRAAEKAGVRITHVAETHIHADFVSGVRELAHATGAMSYLSDMGDANWKYAYADAQGAVLVRDGDRWMVGNIQVEVIATPGHTPEHIAFMITDTAASRIPIGVFTGDFLFVGDVGRPDLLEEAAGLVGTKEPGARQQYRSIERFKALPDHLQIWPAHGAGSACGKALGAIPSTTLGYEKIANPAFQFTSEDLFVRWLLDGQPEAPWYFARMKHVNRVGPALLGDLRAPARLSTGELDALLAAGALVVDVRPQQAYAAGHIPGTLSIPATATMFSTYVGWFVDYARPTYLVVDHAADLERLLPSLRAIGVDDLPGFFIAADALPGRAVPLPTISVEGLAAQLDGDAATVLDVRGKSEYERSHLVGALHIPLGHLPRRLAEIPRERPLVVQCASGYRAHIAASLLRRAGLTGVTALVDPEGRWQELVGEAVA